MASIRILDLLWQFVTAMLIYRIAMEIKQPRGARVLAALLYLLLYYQTDFWTTAQTDGFLNLPITAGILLFLQAQQKDHFWLYTASGVAIGMGVLFKYPIGVLIVFLSLLVLGMRKQKCVFSMLYMVGGFAIPLSAGALIMLVRGNLADFLWTQYTYISKYSTIYNGLGFLAMLIAPLLGWGWVSLPGIYGLFSKSNRSRWMPMVVLGLWWVSAVIHYAIQNKFYNYHALPVFAPLALMISDFFFDVTKTRGLVRFAIGLLATWLLVFLFFTYDFPRKYICLWNVVNGSITLETAYGDEVFKFGKDFSARANMEVAEYVGANTKADEKILIWGFEPSIYFLSQRGNATRFIYNFPLYGPNARPEFRQEFLKEIREQKPIYIVIARNDGIFNVTATNEDSWAAFNSFGEFHDFVLQNYRFETTIEDFTIYRLKP
jgi:hypothetical protein